MKHASIESALFFGSRLNGDEISLEAAVVCRNNAKTSDQDLSRWLRSLMPIEVPIKFHFVHTIPKTAMGKPQRHRLLSSIQLVPKL